MFLKPTLRRISPRWSCSLNSSWQKHLTHSVTQRIRWIQKTFVSRTIRMMHDSFVANWLHTQRLIQDLSFVFTLLLYLYADNLRDSFVGIAMVRLLPGASTTSNNHVSFPTFFGVTHI